MTLFGRRVLIKPDKKEEPSVIITDTDQTPSEYGTVVLVGTDVSAVSTGDRVWWNIRAGRFLDMDGEEHILLDIEDIFAKL